LVQVTAIPDIAKMLNVSRVVVGNAVPNPCGNPKLDADKEKAYRRRIVDKCLELLTTDVDDITIVTPE